MSANTYEARMARGDADADVVSKALEATQGGPVVLHAATYEQNVRLGIDLWAWAPVGGVYRWVALQTKKRFGSFPDLCCELFHVEPVVPGQPVKLRAHSPFGYSIRAYERRDAWDLLVYQDNAHVRVVTRENHDNAMQAALPMVERLVAIIDKAAPLKRCVQLRDGYAIVQAETDGTADRAAFATYNIAIPWSRIDHEALPIP